MMQVAMYIDLILNILRHSGISYLLYTYLAAPAFGLPTFGFWPFVALIFAIRFLFNAVAIDITPMDIEQMRKEIEEENKEEP
jgi:hypothetical protein